MDARNRFPSSLEGTLLFLHLLLILFTSYTYYTLASSDAFSSFERIAGMLAELEILDESQSLASMSRERVSCCLGFGGSF